MRRGRRAQVTQLLARGPGAERPGEGWGHDRADGDKERESKGDGRLLPKNALRKVMIAGGNKRQVGTLSREHATLRRKRC